MNKSHANASRKAAMPAILNRHRQAIRENAVTVLTAPYEIDPDFIKASDEFDRLLVAHVDSKAKNALIDAAFGMVIAAAFNVGGRWHESIMPPVLRTRAAA
jgi:hypothetical protein